MSRRFLLLVLLVTALPLAPLGCETVPYTGRRQLQLVSADEEAKMGVQSYQEITGKAPLSTDGQANALVQRVGSRIDLRPSEAPSVMVSVENVRPDPAIVVGTPVLAATSKLGTAVDIASVEKQALAAHAPEGGNNVSIAVYPSPGSLP